MDSWSVMKIIEWWEWKKWRGHCLVTRILHTLTLTHTHTHSHTWTWALALAWVQTLLQHTKKKLKTIKICSLFKLLMAICFGIESHSAWDFVAHSYIYISMDGHFITLNWITHSPIHARCFGLHRYQTDCNLSKRPTDAVVISVVFTWNIFMCVLWGVCACDSLSICITIQFPPFPPFHSQLILPSFLFFL